MPGGFPALRVGWPGIWGGRSVFPAGRFSCPRQRWRPDGDCREGGDGVDFPLMSVHARFTGLIFAAMLLMPGVVAPLAAQENAPEEATTEAINPAVSQARGGDEAPVVTLLEILEKGGIMMWPLGLLSFIGGLLVLFYLFTIRPGAVVTDSFMDLAETQIRKQDYLGLIASSGRTNQSVARIMQRSMDFATRNPGATFEEVRQVAQAEGVRQAGLLSQRISYLGDVGAIAPMVGLLGTVLGMIKSFQTLGTGAFVGVQQMGLAGGVAEALVTTATGLSIGIPALAFYALFRGRVQKMISEMESATTHLMALVAAQYKIAERRRGATRDGALPYDPNDPDGL